MRSSTPLLLVSLLALIVMPSSVHANTDPVVVRFGQPMEAGCTAQTLTCGATVNGQLTDQDCANGDGTFHDAWRFQGVDQQNAVIELSSGDFDAFLRLRSPQDVPRAIDDDSGGGPSGTDAQLDVTTDENGDWTIEASHVFAGSGTIGDYTLSLQCLGAPAAPSGLMVTTLTSDQITVQFTDNANNESSHIIEIAESDDPFGNPVTLTPDQNSATFTGLTPETTYLFRARSVNDTGPSPWSPELIVTTAAVGETVCTPSDEVTCLNQNRFQVEIDWRDFGGGAGSGSVVPVNSDDSALYWFFQSDNWEFLVKVLDGCGLNQRYWVFAAATTNVEYTLRVTDTDSGMVKEYVNALGTSAPAIVDTDAFATCP